MSSNTATDTITVTLVGKSVQVDEEGCLINRAEWTEDMTKEMAVRDHCELTPDHWVVINFQREYFELFQYSPNQHLLPKAIGKTLGAENKQHQVPIQAVPVRRPSQAVIQVRRPAETDRLHLKQSLPQHTGRFGRSHMHTITVAGKSIEVGENGFLLDLSVWSKEVAEAMARRDNIELTWNHWEVLYLMREYYDEYQISPSVRTLTKAMQKKFGPEKGNKMYLLELFPFGHAIQALKYAGLPPPICMSR